MFERIKKSYQNYLTQNNLVVIFLILCLTTLTFFNVSLIFYSPPTIVEAKEDVISSKIDFWEDFLSSHPTYFEGWVELSNLQLQKGFKDEAILSYNNAFRIDPNSEKLIILQLKLGL